MYHIRAVVFDFDGILVDSEYAHFRGWQYALQQQGGDFTLEEYCHYVGKSGVTISAMLAARVADGCPKKIIEDKNQFYKKFFLQDVRPIISTIDFLQALASEKVSYDFKIAIASASRKVEIQEALKFLGIDHFFDLIVSGYDDLGRYNDPEGVNKPKPYIYLHTAECLGITPRECLVIEDSTSGVRAAVDAGCLTWAVPNSFTQHHDLSHATRIVPSLEGISMADILKMTK